MNILLIDTQSCFLDYALRCIDEGHTVKWFIGPTKEGLRSRVGDGLGIKVTDWQPHMKWADLILLSDNTKYLVHLEKYRKAGFPIFGPNVETASWELDRAKGQSILEHAGIEIIPSIPFTNYDKAIAHVKGTMGRYVSKPNGDADKALSYVSKSPADMVFMLEYWKKQGKMKDPFILQEFHGGIEMAIGGWMGLNGFSPWFLENFEHKKLMNDDKGVNTGEMGCYSADTEVLTKSGWKYWPDVTKQDELATLVDGYVVYETPSAVVSYDVDTDMVAWKNQTLDILVTPNHNMYVQKQNAARKKKDTYEFIQAEDCTQSQYEVNRTASWVGNGRETFDIPEYSSRKGFGVQYRDSITVSAIDFAKFMGLYIAEGSSSKQVNIAQSHPVKADKAEKIVSNIGFKYSRNKHGFIINNVQLAAYTKPFGRSWEKRVPEFVREGTQEVIKAFLEGYALGDGHTYSSGYRCFYSCNRELLGDIQELLLKTGSLGVLSQRPERHGSYIDGRRIKAKRLQYELIERPNKTRSWLDKRDMFTVPYKGKVYCATVSSHILYVRRGGKPLWCGNTVMKYVQESKLADMMLKPIEAELIRQGYTGFIDVSVIIDKRGNVWPLEFTTRPGWPLFQIQQALHRGDSAEWMLDLLNGVDSFNPSEQIAVGVVMAIPDFPYSRLTKKELFGYPVYGVDVHANKHIHPAEMAWSKAPAEENGTIIDKEMFVTAGDYVLICSGTGDTVEEAKDNAYKTVDKVELPNSPMYRTDIGKRLEKQLPELQKHGFATSWEYY